MTVAVSTLNAGGAENKVVSPFSLTLSGGEDEAFPVNTPVVVAGPLLRQGNWAQPEHYTRPCVIFLTRLVRW